MICSVFGDRDSRGRPQTAADALERPLPALSSDTRPIGQYNIFIICGRLRLAAGAGEDAPFGHIFLGSSAMTHSPPAAELRGALGIELLSAATKPFQVERTHWPYTFGLNLSLCRSPFLVPFFLTN